MIYPLDPLTRAQQERLAPHVTSLHSPVYALTNLPETVKAAMFARYSRYPGTLRQLFLDEFADTIEPVPGVDSSEGARAAQLFERVFVGFGDDSVAQLGGVHIAAEWCSNLLTKILQRPRIGASYLEQSTRYIAFDRPVVDATQHPASDWAGQYRYYRDEQLGPQYVQAMDQLFGIYAELVTHMQAWAAEQFPRQADQPERAWRASIHAKALDSVRGLLPAASLSHMGIYASGQAYENLVMHLLAHPLPEARAYGQMMLDALQQVIPSFLSRVERPDRGGQTMAHLAQRRLTGERIARRLGLDPSQQPEQGPSVTLLEHRGTEIDLLAALLVEEAGVSETQVRAAFEGRTHAELLGDLDGGLADSMLAELTGERLNRRHKPGRGLERLSYRFEVVSDYGAFRDLQRHRPLTLQWQTLTPFLGAEIPPEVQQAGAAGRFEQALEISRSEYDRLRGLDVGPESAALPLCLAYRMRYTFDLNAREAMHLCELRSGEAGHPAYRAVAIEMHRQISRVHPHVGAMMRHMDTTTDARLERIQSEIRNEGKRRAAGL